MTDQPEKITLPNPAPDSQDVQTAQPVMPLQPAPVQPAPAARAGQSGQSGQDDMIVISQHTLYYALIAVVFFVAGFIVAYAMQGAVINSAVSQVKAEFSVVAGQAVSTAVAAVPRNAVAVRPTATPIPVQQIDAGDSPFWGPAEAKVTVIEYSDFECPFCAMFHQQTYALLRETYGDRIKFVFKHLPLTSIHPNALPAALASECAREQGKFWEYHDVLFVSTDNLGQAALAEHAKTAGIANLEQFNQCFQTAKYRDRVVADVESANQHFVNATPTFFVNGVHVAGAVPFDTLAFYINQALQAAGG
jgi:protein-disulfide isomerase